MTDLLHRQVHPSFVRDGRPTSQAYRPTPKDDSRLSVSCGRKVDARAAYERHIALKNARGDALRSAGTSSVSREECAKEELPVADAPTDANDAHVVIVFAGLSHTKVEQRAANLLRAALDRGWTFQPAPAAPAGA